jgi:hypothetical protein
MRASKGCPSLFERLEDRRLLAAHIGAATFPTIQAAVDAATPSAVITVDAGTYEEQVFVTTPGLTIQGAAAGVDARSASRGSNESVIRGVEYDYVNHLRSSSFIVWTDDVTIDGFAIQDNNSPGADGSGIVIKPGVSGTGILNNVIRNNTSGISLANASSTKAAVISGNLFDSNNNEGLFTGRGIISNGGISGGVLQNVTIDNNTFTNNTGFNIDPQNNPEAAVSLEAGPEFTQTNIRITNNVMSCNGKGVLAFNASNLTITGNLITSSQDANSAALRFEGNVNGVAIKDNTVTGSLGYAIRIDNKAIAATGQTSSAFAINDNNLYGNGLGALRIFQDTYVVGSGDATGNFWGSSWGPSGSQPGFGDDTQIDNANIAVWQWLSMPSTSAPQLAVSPRALELDALADLKKYRASVTQSDIGKKLDGAITQLTNATNASLWGNDSHPLSTSKSVFDLTQQAVKTLKGLLSNAAVWNIGLTGNIQRFDQAMRSIAQLALDDAIGRDGSANKIKSATTALANGDKDLNNHKYDSCIDDYQNAWSNAIVA